MKFMLEHTGLEGKFLASRKTKKHIYFLRFCPGLSFNIRTCDFALTDVTHSPTKSRTKFLNPDLIALGNYVATSNDLHCLMDKKSREKLFIQKGRFYFVPSMFNCLNIVHFNFYSFIGGRSIFSGQDEFLRS
jgi:hypothetical protein